MRISIRSINLNTLSRLSSCYSRPPGSWSTGRSAMKSRACAAVTRYCPLGLARLVACRGGEGRRHAEGHGGGAGAMTREPWGCAAGSDACTGGHVTSPRF